MRACLLISLILGGCAANGGPPRDGSVGPGDGGVGTDGAIPRIECSETDPCDRGFICAAVDGVPRCVPDPDPPPPGDGTDCRPCPAPGECRMSVCVQPSSTGAYCEFDDACADGELCIAGRCSPDPRIPIPCTADSACPIGQYCAPDGTCGCHFTTDCASGLVCMGDHCTPGPRCVSDDMCMPTEVCDPSGTDADGCRPRTVCEIEQPDLAGTWAMRSRLNVRDALPDWLDSLLAALEGPFRFLAGDADCFDFGLPMAIETSVCDLVRPFLTDFLPPWAAPVFRAIADMNQVLSTWDIEERMTLENGAVADSYRGTHEWLSIRFYYRSMAIDGTPATISDWRFSPSPFNASAVCGTFTIERHDVNLSIGGLIAWLVDTLVYELSDHRYSSAADALTTVVAGLCDAFATAADDAIDYPGIAGTVRGVCTSELGMLVDEAIRELIDARVGASPITLRGSAPINGPDTLGVTPLGVWDGTLLGGDFPGLFCAGRGTTAPCTLPPP